jgi:hypothetical protein
MKQHFCTERFFLFNYQKILLPSRYKSYSNWLAGSCIGQHWLVGREDHHCWLIVGWFAVVHCPRGLEMYVPLMTRLSQSRPFQFLNPCSTWMKLTYPLGFIHTCENRLNTVTGSSWLPFHSTINQKEQTLPSSRPQPKLCRHALSPKSGTTHFDITISNNQQHVPRSRRTTENNNKRP